MGASACFSASIYETGQALYKHEHISARCFPASLLASGGCGGSRAARLPACIVEPSLSLNSSHSFLFLDPVRLSTGLSARPLVPFPCLSAFFCFSFTFACWFLFLVLLLHFVVLLLLCFFFVGLLFVIVLFSLIYTYFRLILFIDWEIF